MEEKLTKIIEVAEVNDATETAEVVADNAPQLDKYKAATLALTPGKGRAWTDEGLKEFARFIASCRDVSYINISLKMGKSENYIYRIFDEHPQLRTYIKELRQQWFEEHMVLAQSVYQEAMESPDVPWTNKLAAAKDVMSKAGYDAVSKVENTNREININLVDDED